MNFDRSIWLKNQFLEKKGMFSDDAREKFKIHCDNKKGKQLHPNAIKAKIKSLTGRKWSEEIIRKRADPNVGKPQTEKGSAKGIFNRHAKKFSLRSPDGVRYDFINLSDFVRNNIHLFPEEFRYEIPRSKNPKSCSSVPYCAKGLACLFKKKAPKGSWRGWTRVTHSEFQEDILQRNFITKKC